MTLTPAVVVFMRKISSHHIRNSQAFADVANKKLQEEKQCVFFDSELAFNASSYSHLSDITKSKGPNAPVQAYGKAAATIMK